MDGPHATAFADASRFFVDVVARVPVVAWDRPGLGDWSLRELVGHGNRSHTLLEDYLERPHGPEPANGSYFGPEAIAERGRVSAAALGTDPVAAVRRDADLAAALVAATPPDAALCTPLGTITLSQYLPSRTAELTIHGLDVARVIGADLVPPDSALVESLVFAARRSAPRAGVEVLLALTGRGSLPPGYSVY